MTYKPVNRTSKARQKVLADKKARAIYESTKLQIGLVMELREALKSLDYLNYSM